MSTKTLIHLNYLNRVYILVNLENERDYSLHLKVKNKIDRRTYKEIEGNEKPRIAAYLMAVERYHLWQEVIDSGKAPEEVKKDESYLQLVGFINELSPGYAHRWEYINETEIVKDETRWRATYQGVELIYNQMQEPKTVFHLVHEFNPDTKEIHQCIEWVVPENELLKNSLFVKEQLLKIKEDGMLFFKQAMNPALPSMFEGFEDLLGD